MNFLVLSREYGNYSLVRTSKWITLRLQNCCQDVLTNLDDDIGEGSQQLPQLRDNEDCVVVPTCTKHGSTQP